MEPILGQIAALVAAICWAICSPCFTLAGRRIGSVAVNIHRLVIAGVILGIYSQAVRGIPFPTDASTHVYGWLIASGTVGFFVCDLCLFRSFLLIGPRLAMLILAMSPPLAALIDWGFRGITLNHWAIFGMTVTLSGIGWVVSERRSNEQEVSTSQWKFGLFLALTAATSQAVGMVFADIGLNHDGGEIEKLDPFAANQIRLCAGLAAFLVMITITRQWRPVLAGVKDPLAIGWLFLGAFTGTFLGVGFGLLSLRYIPTGMALTLMSLPPVFILPIAWLLLKEKISLRAILGAIVAVVGVGILFLS